MSDSVTIVAREYIPAFCVATADGRVADSANLTQEDKLLGVCELGSAAGFARIMCQGVMTNYNWRWEPGSVIYLHGIDLSEEPPPNEFHAIIGYALTAMTMWVDPQLNGGYRDVRRIVTEDNEVIILDGEVVWN